MVILLQNISSFFNALVIFLVIYQSQSKHSRLVLQKNLFFKKTLWPFLWMGFDCLNSMEQLGGLSLLSTTKSPGVPGTHFFQP